MNALIIGGTGFFGKSILDAFISGLLKRFGVTKITVLARNIDSFKKSNPELIDPGIDYLEGDIAKLKNLPEFDVIIHAATSTNLKNYSDQPFAEKDNLELGVTNFCHLISQSNLNSKMVYCSSGAVYGRQPIHLEKMDELCPFNDDFKSISPEKLIYLQGKRYAELEIIKLGTILKRNVSIARCFAFSGKYVPRDLHYAYGNFLGSAEKGEKIIVDAAGIVYRSFMEADDLVLSLFEIALHSNPNCPIFNVGSDIQVSLYDLARNMADRYGVEYEFKNFDDSKIIDRYVPNVDRLKKLLLHAYDEEN
jgi:dTDP-glucose 4,6-dehydratase